MWGWLVNATPRPAFSQGKRPVTHRTEGRDDPRAGKDRTDFGNDTVFRDYRGSFPRVKRPGPEADHSSSSSTEIENEWSDTSTPSIRLHGMDRENFTFIPIWNAWSCFSFERQIHFNIIHPFTLRSSNWPISFVFLLVTSAERYFDIQSELWNLSLWTN